MSHSAAAKHSSEAESYLIGAMMTNPGIRNNLLSEMTPQDFYNENNRRVFIGISELDQDTPSLSGWIKPRDLDLDEIDQKYAARLLSEEPSTARWKRAKEKVRDTARIRDLAVNVEAWQQELEQTEDVDNIAARALSALEGALSSGTTQGAQHISTTTDAVYERMESVRRNQGILGLKTGIALLDRKLGGLQKERNIIVGARSGHGKTTLATTVVKNVMIANPGARVLVQSTEQTREQYVELLARAQAYITDAQMETGDISDEQMVRYRVALDECNEFPLWVDDFAGATPDVLRRNVLRIKPDLVVIDYLQRMQLPRNMQGRSKYEDTSTLSLEVDRLKSTYHTSLFTVVQLSRKSEDREDHRPRESDIRDTGQIEQDGNQILMLHRPVKYDKSARTDESVLECVKNRHGEAGWAIKLWKNQGIPYLTDDEGLGVGYGGRHPERV